MNTYLNILWVLISTLLVLFMTSGLAFFYGGLVRKKNALSTLMMSFISFGVVGIIWCLVGYSLAYGESNNLFIGSFEYLFMSNLNADLHIGQDVPSLLDMLFQGSFAIIAAALISGSVVERINFRAYLIFISLWVLFVYSPMAKWVWGDGLFEHLPLGATLDFAGGTVVHVNAAISAIVLSLYIGNRNDIHKKAMLPHHVPFTLLGAGILWFGWFGFNGGSAYAINSQAIIAVTNTFISPAACIVGWMILDLIFVGRITAVGLATAIVVGLVAITPAAGLVSPSSAIFFGLITCLPCYFTIMFKDRAGLDDSLDVFGAHGIGGIVGSLLTGCFVSKMWGAEVDASFNQFLVQLLALVISIIYSGLVTWLIAVITNVAIPLRVRSRHERVGLDLAMHGEEAYTDGEGALLIVANDSEKASKLINKK